MFDSISFGELAVIGIVALIVIGPKDLPRAMHFVGKWVGKGRALSRQFRGHVDELVRSAEMEEMERKWRAQNEQIMRAQSAPSPATPLGQGDPALLRADHPVPHASHVPVEAQPGLPLEPAAAPSSPPPPSHPVILP